MKKNDGIFDALIETRAYIERLDFDSSRNLVDELDNLASWILKQYDKSLNKREIEKVLKSIASGLSQIYEDFKEDLSADMGRAGLIFMKKELSIFEKIYPDVKIPYSFEIPEKAIAVFESRTPTIILESNGQSRKFSIDSEINKLKTLNLRNYRRFVRNNLVSGKRGDEAARQVARELDGITVKQKAQLTSIARTAIADASRRAQDHTEEKFLSDVIKGYQWLSILDTRTTFFCASRHGMIKKSKSDFHTTPPAHFRCRSMLMPVTELSNTNELSQKSRVWDEKITTDKNETGLRKTFKAAEIKQTTIKVPPATDKKYSAFDSWFKELSPKRQIQYLGVERYKLYRQGLIGSKTLVDGSGKIRTVKELASLVGVSGDDLKELKKRDLKSYEPEISRNAQKVIVEKKKSG